MGRKKYYCDYCEKSFADSLDARKKHNAGLVHQRMRDAHYKQFKDARTKLKEELQKGPCRRVQTGLPCKFGDECRFSHLQPYELDQLKYDAQVEEEMASVKIPSQLRGKRIPSVEDFVSKVEALVKKREAESLYAIAAANYSSSLSTNIEHFPSTVEKQVESQKIVLPYSDNDNANEPSTSSVNLPSATY